MGDSFRQLFELLMSTPSMAGLITQTRAGETISRSCSCMVFHGLPKSGLAYCESTCSHHNRPMRQRARKRRFKPTDYHDINHAWSGRRSEPTKTVGHVTAGFSQSYEEAKFLPDADLRSGGLEDVGPSRTSHNLNEECRT